MRRADVVICTTMMAGELLLSRYQFEFCVCDEAAQAVEPDLLVPTVLGARQLVLVGDHKQIGPVVKCRAAERAGYGYSMFERLATGLVSPHLLDTQYRMHPALSEYPSTAFYEGLLKDGVTSE